MLPFLMILPNLFKKAIYALICLDLIGFISVIKTGFVGVIKTGIPDI